MGYLQPTAKQLKLNATFPSFVWTALPYAVSAYDVLSLATVRAIPDVQRFVFSHIEIIHVLDAFVLFFPDKEKEIVYRVTYPVFRLNAESFTAGDARH